MSVQWNIIGCIVFSGLCSFASLVVSTLPVIQGFPVSVCLSVCLSIPNPCNTLSHWALCMQVHVYVCEKGGPVGDNHSVQACLAYHLPSAPLLLPCM